MSPAPEGASQGFELELIAPSIAPALRLALTCRTACLPMHTDKYSFHMLSPVVGYEFLKGRTMLPLFHNRYLPAELPLVF